MGQIPRSTEHISSFSEECFLASIVKEYVAEAVCLWVCHPAVRCLFTVQLTPISHRIGLVTGGVLMQLDTNIHHTMGIAEKVFKVMGQRS